MWTADRKAALERAFHESGKPYAADALRSVEAALDRYAIGLAMMQTESCEATRVRGEQSEEMRGLRAACLDDRRAAFASFVDTLATGDGANVAAAIPGVHALPPVAACGDLDALRAGARRRKPHDAATQARLDALARALTDTEGAYEAGALSSLRERTDRLVADARELADPALLGRALTLRGSVRYQTQQEQVAIPDFRDAAWAALAAGDDEGVARACTGLIDLTLHTDDAQTARTWRDCARAAVTRLGAPPDLDSTVTLSEADLVDRDGDLDGGTHLRRRAIELIEQADGKDSLRLIQPLDNLAIGLEERGLVDEALPIARRAVALGEKQVGPSVPMVARARMTLGSIHATLHQLDDATRELTRARTDLAAELGEDSPDVAAADDILAGVLSDEKRWDEALALYTRALDVRRRKLGPRHPFVGRSLANIGITQVSRGRWAEGIAALEEALPLLDRDGDSDESSTAIVLSSLGEAQIGAGQPSAALPTLARARALLEKHGDDADTLAKAEFQTARALSQIGREPAEARRLAQSARTRLAAEKAPADEIANVDQWLAQHPSSTSGSIR